LILKSSHNEGFSIGFIENSEDADFLNWATLYNAIFPVELA